MNPGRNDRNQPRNDFRHEARVELRGPSLPEIERWSAVIVQRLQVPLQRLTLRERFELLSCVGKLERTAPRFLPAEARSLPGKVREKLARETGDTLAEILTGHPLAAWSDWTARVFTQATPELLRELLAALDDTEAAVATVASLQPRAIRPDLDDLLSQCRTWVERHGKLFAVLRPEVERLCDTMHPDLEQENYDLAVTLLKFEAILDPILDDAAPVAPAPFTSAVLDALLRQSR